MKRHHFSFLVSLALAGFLFLASSVQSLAVDDVKFACSHHGPADMSLTLKFEQGDPQTIVIEGKNTNTKWFVTINAQPAASGNGGDNGDTIKVHSGDTITWILTAANHGVAFAEKDVANAMLKDLKAGVPLQLEDLTTTLTSDAWKHFGTKRWGVKRLDAVMDGTIIMVTGTVK